MHIQSPQATITVKPCLTPSALKFVELQLANYLGTEARTLVSRAAAQSPGADTLILRLAESVANPTERHGFMQNCSYYLG